MMRNAAVLAGVVVAVLVTAASAVGADTVAADDPMRTLHDTYCVMCHDTQVYTRESRLARDYLGVREQVDRWQTNLSLKWRPSEVDMMTNWLVRNYYKIDCPRC